MVMKRLFIPIAILVTIAFIITGCSTTSTTTTLPATAAATSTSTTVAPATTSTTVTPTGTAPATTTPVSSTSPVYGGTLRYISAQVPGTPIGWMPETTGASTFSMQLSLEFLLHEDSKGNLTPWLTNTFEVDPNPPNPSITFHLRQGVKFSDGSDFNSQAVAWNLDQSKTGLGAALTEYMKSYETPDPYTIKIYFTRWENTNPRNFADANAYLVSPTAYEKNGKAWMEWHMVGTGPFTQTDFQRDVSLTTVKNQNYWRSGEPYLDGAQMIYVIDQTTRQALFESGGGDLVDCAGSFRMAHELQTKGYQILEKKGGTTALIPDSKNADSPWSNLEVREAAEYAIDKVAISNTFGYGFTQPAYQVPSPAVMAYDPAITGRTYDVAKAKQLLADAGYPNGFKTTLIAANTANQNLVLAIQSYLAKVGIQAQIQLVEGAKVVSYLIGKWDNGLLLDSMLQWPNFNQNMSFYFGEPPFFYQVTKHPAGWADLMNASINAPTESTTLDQQCVQALYNDATIIPLYFGATLTGATNNVHDTNISGRSSIYWDPESTWLSK